MSQIDYTSRIATFDPTRQYDVLTQLDRHVSDGFRIGMAADMQGISLRAFTSVTVCGMGGSAIGGDILRNLACPEAVIPVHVVRNYALPAFVDARSLVFVMSYSGSTEETRSAWKQAFDAGATIVAVTAGQAFAETVRAGGGRAIMIEGGFAPRAAIGYLFFALLGASAQIGLLSATQRDVDALAAFLAGRIAQYSAHADVENPAIAIAERLHGKLPVVYSSPAFEAANLRWRCQIEENAKTLAYGHVFPELNHNEIVGWEQLPDLLARIAIVLFRDAGDLHQIRHRMDITRNLLAPLAGDVIEIDVEGDTPLERMFGLICLGDWVSYYLAIGTGVDPFPIVKINLLKNALAAAEQ